MNLLLLEEYPIEEGAIERGDRNGTGGVDGGGVRELDSLDEMEDDRVFETAVVGLAGQRGVAAYIHQLVADVGQIQRGLGGGQVNCGIHDILRAGGSDGTAMRGSSVFSDESIAPPRATRNAPSRAGNDLVIFQFGQLKSRQAYVLGRAEQLFAAHV